MDSAERRGSAKVIDRRIEGRNTSRLFAGRRRASVETYSVHQRSIARFDCQIGAGWQRRRFSKRFDRHVKADRSSVMRRAVPRSSATQELELIPPSKLAIE